MSDATVLNLGKTPSRTVLKLSWPAIAEQFLISMASLIDTAMVGSLGPIATAAVSINVSTIWLAEGFSTALSAGFMYMIATSIGEGNLDNARSATRQSITASILLGAITSIIILLISPHLCIWLGGKPEVYNDARNYLTFIGYGMIFKAMTIILSSSLRAAGNMKAPLRINIVANLLNVIGNFILIYPTRSISLFGNTFIMPGVGLGVEGAAISTSLSYLISAFMLLVSLYIVNTPAKLTFKGSYLFTIKIMKRVIKISIPVALERITLCLGQIVLTKLLSGAGTIALAVHQLVNQCESLMYLPAYGFASSGTTLIGQSIGANKSKMADDFAKTLFIINEIFILIICIPMFIFAGPIISLFTPSAETVELGIIALRITAASEPLFALTVVMGGICRGSGDVKFPLIISLGGMWFIRLTLAFLFSHILDYGLIGIEIALAIDVSIRGIVCIWRLKSGKWNPLNSKT